MSDPLHGAMEAEFNRAAGVDGWSMRDLPRLSPPLFDELLERIGRDEVKVMVGSKGNFTIKDGKSVPAEPWVRATILISPRGLDNLRASRTGEAQ